MTKNLHRPMSSTNVTTTRSASSYIPFLLRRCEGAIAVGMSAGLLLGLSGAIPFLLSEELGIRASIYSVTGSVFWKNYFVLFFAVGGIISSFYALELSLKGKASLYVQKDKIELLRQLYVSPNCTKMDRLLAFLCSVFAVAFATSFGLQMGLGILKFVVLR